MYRVILDRVPIECETLEEAKRLARSIANEDRLDTTKTARSAAAKRRSRFVRNAVSLLTTIRDAGSEGTTGEKLRTALGLETLKGLGPIVAATNNQLNKGGIKPEQVFEKKRIGKERRWIGKEKLVDAIKLLEH